jgi:hypothetical protein
VRRRDRTEFIGVSTSVLELNGPATREVTGPNG